MNDVGRLLVAADRQAREILLDGPDPERAKGLLLGWAEAMETAADTLTAIPDGKTSHQQAANVLTQVSRASAAVHMDARRGWTTSHPTREHRGSPGSWPKPGSVFGNTRPVLRHRRPRCLFRLCTLRGCSPTGSRSASPAAPTRFNAPTRQAPKLRR